MQHNKKRGGVQRQNGHSPNNNEPKDKMLKFVPKDTPIHEVDHVLLECKIRNSGPTKCCHCSFIMNNLIEESEYRCDRCRDWDDDVTGYICKGCYYSCPNPKLMAYGLQHMLFGRIVWN